MFDRKKCKERIKTILSMDNHPGHISAGFAVGVFISFTPFYGCHFLMAVVASFIFRLNKLTCLTGTWVNNPLTVVPVTALSFQLGRFLRGLPSENVPIREMDWDFIRGAMDWHFLKGHAASLLLGSSVLGFIAAVLSYFICYYLVVNLRRRDDTLKTLTDEMKETGEDLEKF